VAGRKLGRCRVGFGGAGPAPSRAVIPARYLFLLTGREPLEEESLMKPDITDINLVVDRSGSMQKRREDAEGGVNAFIQEQAGEPGEAYLTLAQFDTEYEIVHRGVPIQDVPEYKLEPRGMTSLLDAVGRSINEAAIRIQKMKKASRPGLVIFVITTDGLENSSVEFTKAQIKEMIEERQSKDGWKFTFLGANQDAFAEAGGMGIRASAAADYSMHKVGKAYEMTSKKISRMRSQHRTGQEVKDEYTDEEREAMK
jgi:hypothetical protein